MNIVDQYNFLENEINSTIECKKFQIDINLKLERMKIFMKLLGNPEKNYKVIHVGGTAGKGSTATMISNILHSHGYNVGLHTSPHLQVINERHCINGIMISTTSLLNMWSEIKPHIKWMDKNCEFGMPTYFEIQVALSFKIFEKHNVDYAVIEVGLGGNLDATNIVLPEIAVLTNVGLDHVEILGDTVEKIAKDKAGIIKNNITVITGAYQKSVLSIFQKICKEKKSELFILGKDFHILDNVSLKLYGKAQVQNASLAYYVSKKLLGEKYNKKQALQALEKTSIAARIEILQEEPLVILDGAHNSIKIKASIESIRKLSNGRKIYTLFALKDDKDYEDIFTEINNISQNITCTEFIEKLYWKSYDAVGLAKKFAALYPDSFIKSDKNCLNALKRLMKIIKKDEILWVVGSLYLAGDIRECWVSSESILKKLE